MLRVMLPMILIYFMIVNNGNTLKNGTIVLGFQLESLIEHKVLLYRQLHKEQILISDKSLRFSNYQFSFVNTVKPRQLVSVEIKESQFKEGENTTLSNRIGVKADGVLVLLGYKKGNYSPRIISSSPASAI
jgi:hypothetical protein